MKRIFFFSFCLLILLTACQGKIGEVVSQDEIMADVLKSDALKPVIIELTDQGFKPNLLYVHAGEIVTFHNTGSIFRWPASDPHPTHQGCPGFDPKISIRPGGKWSFRFIEVAECSYHDHLSPDISGRVSVQP